ncbi:MAG TPA: TCP-1/cpn60 chaperonin family protein, partial [Anaerolineales bacterium]|nr:TCP-1/cpn60 chaperonin family protein [Anaerolineales bacterium]
PSLQNFWVGLIIHTTHAARRHGRSFVLLRQVRDEDVRSQDHGCDGGINIVKKALEAPIRKLAANAGQDGSVIIDTVRRTAVDKKNKNIGYNVLTGEYTDMIVAGVIDPVKVVRGALENAASIAAMILTTDVLITDLPEKDKAPAMPPGGMGGMDY